MNFIRKNKEKSNKNTDKSLDLPPSLTLPSFSLDASVPIAVTSPPPSLPTNPTNPLPLPDNAPSSASPPLYARFARGTFELREPELLSPSSPRQTLRHRSSNESGAGFRSSGVRDEVERLVVAKRNAIGAKSGRDSPSVRAPSIRSVMSGRDSPLPSLGEIAESPIQPRRTISQPLVALPRPPTPPPPSPPKIIFAKKLPTLSPEKSLPAAPSLPAVSPAPSPSPILIPITPPSKTLPLSSPVSSPSALLASPTTSPGASRRRAYSPLAAFHSIKDNSNALMSNVVDINGKDPDVPSSITSASTSTSTPVTPASTTFMAPPEVTGTIMSSSPTTMNLSTKSSTISSTASSNESGHAGTLRPTGISKGTIKNGTTQAAGSSVAEGENSPMKGSSFGLREKGYFAMYPDRDRDKVKRTIENFDAPSSLHKVNSSSGEPVTPISSRPSKSSISTVEDDDPSLQAFVKNLPSSVSRHTTGDSETSSIASNILANATFGETNRRIPRGTRLSRIGSGFSNGNGVEEIQMNAPPPVPLPDKNYSSTSSLQALSRKTSGSVFEEIHTSKIPTASANASTSTLNSLSTHSREHSHNSTPNTPSSSRIASKSESVRERVRALEEEREREREKERLRRSTPWVRKDGTVGIIKSKKEEKESNSGRSVSSSTAVQQASSPMSPIHDKDITSSTQNKDDYKVDESAGSNPRLEETFPPCASPQPESSSTTATTPEPVTQPLIQTQTSSERPTREKTTPPSFIPVASNSSQSRLLGMKPLPAHDNNSLAGHEAGEVEDNGTGSIETGVSNKAGIGAFGDTTVPPVAQNSLDAAHSNEVHNIVEPPVVNTRLRSGSTFDLDDDPFVRGPLVRQSTPAQVTTVTTPVSVPVDTIDPPTDSPKLHPELPNDVPLSGEINGGEGTVIVEKPPASNGTDDYEISEKNLPLTPSATSAVDTVTESHPPVAPINISRKYHKHNESVATTYSNESDSDKSDEVEGGDTTDDNTPPLPPYPLERHLCHPYLFHSLLKYLSYADVLNVLSLNHSIRRSLTDIRDLREEVLERFLHTVGYSRWNWQGKEPLVLSLKDLNAYLRGVSTPMHEYATIADAYLAQHAGNTIPASRILRTLAASCRSYTRLVIRLREHAEAEYAARALPHAPTSPGSPGSPTSIKHARHLSVQSATFSADSHDSSNAYNQQRSSVSSGPLQYRKFTSPLYRLHHAPLLRVFVPSANGAWLSDESVLECEKELKRAGVLPFLRPGDVIWDTAVAEEMNAGRLVWDGSYLIDLDYSYTLAGELPRYLHSLSFPPSYFHKVIQANGNPLCQIDVGAWGAEIINNVQLVQDKVITNTPQAAQHSVLRWVHRSRFQIIPGTPIPDSDELIVDPKWVGTVVVEAEGTNEGLGNLLGRCGEQVATKAEAMTGGLSNTLGKGEVGRAFRLIRSKSRPGEIWLRCVSEKEKLT